MRLGTLAGNLIERLALAAGIVPTPLFDTAVAELLSRTVLAGTRLGIFEALREQPLYASDIASACETDPAATETLLNALAGAGYLRVTNGRYRLTPLARKWLLRDSPTSLRDALLFQRVENQFIEHFEDFVRTGQPLDIHDHMTPGQWELYQRAMRSGANLSVREVTLRTPVPRHATSMLDIGGSHGYYSVALCRRHPALRSVILDLPQAVVYAQPLLEREEMGERITYRAGDARTCELGADAYDLIFVANLVHHFDEATNRDLVTRAAQALRPGGMLVIAEIVRPAVPSRAGQVGALTDLFFAATSRAGTWSRDEIVGWQRAAGLAPRRAIALLTAPGAVLQCARQPHS